LSGCLLPLNEIRAIVRVCGKKRSLALLPFYYISVLIWVDVMLIICSRGGRSGNLKISGWVWVNSKNRSEKNRVRVSLREKDTRKIGFG
jgi:hypothetical protein